jgi:predicted permease
MAYSANRDAAPRFNLGMMVSGNFFSGLGIQIPVGRSFFADEDSVNGKDSVAVISYSMWERDYGASPAAIGRQIRVNGAEFSIIGVAPEGFAGPEAFLLPEVYIPMHSFQQVIPTAKADYLTARDNRRFTLLGRLAMAAREGQAEAELSTVARQLAAQYPDTNKDRTVTALSYIRTRYENDPEDAQFALGILFIGTLVLLIACANVASLSILRSTARAQEIAIRMAIGGSRSTLVQQLLTESLLLAILGGTAGLAVGFAGVQFLNSIEVPSDFPIAFGARMDQRMFLFSLLASIATGIVFGLWPALRATRTDLISTIKSSDQGPAKAILGGRFTARNVLTVAQLTLSVVLVSFSGYFVRGFQAVQRLDLGMRTDHTLFFTLDPAFLRYDEAKTRQFYRELKDRLKELPGVRAVSLSSSIPFSTGQSDRPMIADGYSLRPGENAPVGWTYAIDEDYLALWRFRRCVGGPSMRVIRPTLPRWRLSMSTRQSDSFPIAMLWERACALITPTDQRSKSSVS